MDYRLKRVVDLGVLVLGHVVMAPFWLIVWVLVPMSIWLADRGPVFYRQSRIGKGGHRFEVLKFRTMRHRHDGERWAQWTLDDDPRITLPGRILRRTALDELPQIVNIWRGELSFVGPRPLAPDDFSRAVDEDPKFGERQSVTPGLTGLAQLYLPRDCSPRKRRRYDCLYIRNASPFLDLKLILRSVGVSFAGKWGAGFRVTQNDNANSKTTTVLVSKDLDGGGGGMGPEVDSDKRAG